MFNCFGSLWTIFNHFWQFLTIFDWDIGRVKTWRRGGAERRRNAVFWELGWWWWYKNSLWGNPLLMGWSEGGGRSQNPQPDNHHYVNLRSRWWWYWSLRRYSNENGGQNLRKILNLLGTHRTEKYSTALWGWWGWWGWRLWGHLFDRQGIEKLLFATTTLKNKEMSVSF